MLGLPLLVSFHLGIERLDAADVDGFSSVSSAYFNCSIHIIHLGDCEKTASRCIHPWLAALFVCIKNDKDFIAR